MADFAAHWGELDDVDNDAAGAGWSRPEADRKGGDKYGEGAYYA